MKITQEELIQILNYASHVLIDDEPTLDVEVIDDALRVSQYDPKESIMLGGKFALTDREIHLDKSGLIRIVSEKGHNVVDITPLFTETSDEILNNYLD